MKTYYLTLSHVFPSTHPRAGEYTFFRDKLHAAITGNADYWNKLHTIRANYDFWAKRFEKIAAGEAVLSIREWAGKPYGKGSSMRELALLTHEDGICIQQLRIATDSDNRRYALIALIDGITLPSLRVLAHNDGLSLKDWESWFKGYDISKPMAIIHFTKFRY